MTCYGQDGWLAPGSSQTSQAECEQNGGQWLEDEDIPPVSGPSGPTAPGPGPTGPTAPPGFWKVFVDVTRIEPLIALDILEIAVNFRDEIMTTTLVGAILRRGYYRHFGEAVRLMRRNEELQLRMLQAWGQVHAFASQMLVAHRGGQPRSIRLEKRTYDRVAQLCDSLARASRKEDFRKAVAEVKKECRRYVGVTPAEGLRLCTRNLKGSSLWMLAPPRKSGRSGAIKRKTKAGPAARRRR